MLIEWEDKKEIGTEGVWLICMVIIFLLIFILLFLL